MQKERQRFDLYLDVYTPQLPENWQKRLRITPKKVYALHSLALTLLTMDANGVCVCITKDLVTATVRTLLLSCTAGCPIVYTLHSHCRRYMRNDTVTLVWMYLPTSQARRARYGREYTQIGIRTALTLKPSIQTVLMWVIMGESSYHHSIELMYGDFGCSGLLFLLQFVWDVQAAATAVVRAGYY